MQEMTKAIFLDRDGTINVDRHYLYRIEEFEFLPHVAEGLKLLQEDGFLLIILTNQSGIARGYYTVKELEILNEWMIRQLECKGVVISKIFYCPHLPKPHLKKYGLECNCRKPAPGMFERAVLEFDIDLSQSYTIGDRLRDHSICKESSCRGYLVGNSERKEIIEEIKKGYYDRIKYMDNLYLCALDILNIAEDAESGGNKL